MAMEMAKDGCDEGWVDGVDNGWEEGRIDGWLWVVSMVG